MNVSLSKRAAEAPTADDVREFRFFFIDFPSSCFPAAADELVPIGHRNR